MKGPSRLFIVRHGEREDHVNNNLYLTETRPHDVTLTDNGKDMAVKLGRYLYLHRTVNDIKNIIVLTSPLLRCVQTAHGICEGLIEGVRRAQEGNPTETRRPEGTGDIPIYIEHGLSEGPKWLNHDIEKDMKMKRGTGIPIDVYALEPVVYSPEHFRKSVSPFVQPNFFNDGKCFASADFFVNKDTSLTCERDEPSVNRTGSDIHHRCALLSKLVEVSGDLDGKTVILVGHGETTVLVHNSLSLENKYKGQSPWYTGWQELKRKSEHQKDDYIWEHTEGHIPFSTPHLERD
eukprot:Tbor_TRINITY_DN4388_c0_g2::TRINITY_DN4388_c0_g2_i1::g.7860::m.7860